MKLIRARHHNILPVFLILICFLFSNGAQAQRKRVYSRYFRPQAYVSITGGGNWLLAEGYREYLFTGSLGQNAGFLFGYEVTPALSLRASYMYLNQSLPDVLQVNPDNSFYVRSFTSQAFMGELALNILGANRRRMHYTPYGLMIFGGVGAIHREKAGFNSALMAAPALDGGLQLSYSLSRYLDLNLTGQGYILPDNYNERVSAFPAEILTTGMIGLTWHFRPDDGLH